MLPATPRILIVEDNRQNADSFARILGHYDVRVVYDGLDAIRSADEMPSDIYLIDLDLPDINGTHVALSLRRRMSEGELPLARLVALTARNDVDTRAVARRSGFDGFLGKPCTASQLVSIIDALLTDKLQHHRAEST